MMDPKKINPSTAAEDVSLRVKNTRKEIQDLKAELEMLITSGIKTTKVSNHGAEHHSHGDFISKSDQVIDTFDTDSKSSLKVTAEVLKKDIFRQTSDGIILRSTEPNRQREIEKPAENAKTIPESEVSKRSKNYNRAETREWMKRRRERVTEDLRTKVKESQASIDIKREKLRQLHEKCLLIVSTNVQKRGRCKSDDRISAQKIDTRSRSCDPLNRKIDAKPGSADTEIIHKKISDSQIKSRSKTKQNEEPTKSAPEKRIQPDSNVNEKKYLSSVDNVVLAGPNNIDTTSKQHCRKNSSKTAETMAKSRLITSASRMQGKRSVQNKQKTEEKSSVPELISKFENDFKQGTLNGNIVRSTESLLSVSRQPLCNPHATVGSKDLKAIRVEFEKSHYVPTLKVASDENRQKAKTRIKRDRSKTPEPLLAKNESESANVRKLTSRQNTRMKTNKEARTVSNSNKENKKHVSTEAKSQPELSAKCRNRQNEEHVRNTVTVRHVNDRVMDLSPHLLNQTDNKNKSQLVIDQCGRTFQEEEVLKSKNSEFALLADLCNKVTKDTQTVDSSNKLGISPWLQVPNNLNFINIVKEKLKAVIQSPGYLKDVGVQSSLIEHNFVKNTNDSFELPSHIRKEQNFVKNSNDSFEFPSQVRKEELRDRLKANILTTELNSADPENAIKKSLHDNKSDMSPFLSHNLLDLKSPVLIQDIRTVSGKKQIVPKVPAQSDILSNITITNTGSDSDTSKNIPDISSEHSSTQKQSSKVKTRKNSSSQLEIDINNLKDLNLKSRSLSGTNNSNLGNEKASLNAVDCEKDSRRATNSEQLKNKYLSTQLSDLMFSDNTNNGKSQNKLISFDRILHVDNKQFTERRMPSYENSKSSSHNSITVRSNTVYSVDFNSLNDTSSHKSSNDHLNCIQNSISRRKVPSKHSFGNEETSSLEKNDKSSAKTPFEKKSESIQTSRNDGSGSRGSSEITSVPAHQYSQRLSQGIVENRSRSDISMNTSQSSIEILTERSNAQTDFPKSVTLRNTGSIEDISLLKAPSLRLEVDSIKSSIVDKGKLIKTLSLTAGGIQTNEAQTKSNEIHLKFEAEVHLLNDFNESLKQFMAVEKAFETLKQKNGLKSPNINYQTRDTQTSLQAKTPVTSKISETKEISESTQQQISGINYSRGSEIIDDLRTAPLETTINVSKPSDDTFMSTTGLTGFELSNLNDTIDSFVEESRMSFSASNIENMNGSSISNISLKMFEQLIKDEDIRIDNLKTIIKIREKSLLDRTKTELALLEIQRKQLKETGQLDKVSDIRKKQRGIILKHQHERDEMQKLKQMQKAASKERKSILRQQSNFLKSQLSTNNMLSKIKVSTPRQKKHSSGPLRVLKTHSEIEIKSDMTASRRSSITEELLSITSHTSTSASEEATRDVEAYALQHITEDTVMNQSLSHVKQALLMREAALDKRRKAAEELLKWHQRLLEEERKISELESAADIVINQIPSATTTDKDALQFPFKGSQLNQLLHNMTGREDKEYLDDEMYMMSQAALEKFYRKSKELGRNSTNKRSDKINDMYKNQSESINISVSSIQDIPESSRTESVRTEVTSQVDIQSEISDNVDNVYTSDFDNDSVKTASVKQNELDRISSISELIDNFSKIKEEISLLSRRTERNISQIIEDVSVHSSNTHPHNESGSSTSIVSTQLFTDDEKSNQMKTHSGSTSPSIQSQFSPNSEGKGSIESILNRQGNENTEKIANSGELVSDAKDVSEAVKVEIKQRGSSHLSPVLSPNLHTTATLELNEEKSGTHNSIVSSPEVSKLDSIMIMRDGAENVSDNNKGSSKVVSPQSDITDKAASAEDNVEDHITSIENKFLETVDKSLNIVNSIMNDKEDNTLDSAGSLSSESSMKSRNDPSKDAKAEVSVEIIPSIAEVAEDISPRISEYIEMQNDEISSEDISVIASSFVPASKESKIMTVGNEEPVCTPKQSCSEDVSESLLDATPKLPTNSHELTTQETLSDAEWSKSAHDSENIIAKAGTFEETADLLSKTEHVSSRTSDHSVRSHEILKLNNISEIVNTGVSLQVPTEQSNGLYLESQEAISQVQTQNSRQELGSNHESREPKVSVPNSLLLEESHTHDSESLIEEVQNFSREEFSKEETDKSKPSGTSDIISDLIGDSEACGISSNIAGAEHAMSNSRTNNDVVILDNSCSIDESQAVQTDGTPESAIQNASKSKCDSSIVSSLRKRHADQIVLTAQSATVQDNSSLQDRSEFSNNIDEATGASEDPTKMELSHLLRQGEDRSFTNNANENQGPKNAPFVEDLQDKSDNLNRNSIEQSIASDSSVEIKTGEQITDATNAVSTEEDFQTKSDNLVSGAVEQSILSKSSVGNKKEEEFQLEANTVRSPSSIGSIKSEKESDKTTDSSDTTPADKHVDVKKRVSEILAEANQGSRGDKSPRLQDLYVTAYDIISPANSPEIGSPEHNGTQSLAAGNIFGDEAKELMMKQLAIEQEIKQIEEQQKEHIPYVFIREIPNKPPPPYTPPTPQQSPPTVLPTDVADIQEVTSYAATVLHKAYVNKNLSNVRLKECNFKLVSKRNISKPCCELLFDLCTELATDHYKQFEEPEAPSWLRTIKKPPLTVMKPFDVQVLERYMNRKLKELFGFEKPEMRESAIIKWSRKKRDHVDEILVLESQSEDSEWINYEKDELLVKDELTNDLMNMLFSETADIFSKLISKKTFTQ